MNIGRRCWHCGGSTFHQDLDGERFCLVCGRQALPPMSMTDAARLGGVSLRTVKRWVDAGLVAASPPMGSGRPRMADAAGVLLLVDRRSNIEGHCEWCARVIPPPGVRRSHRVTRRWCSGRCKSADQNRRLRRPAEATNLAVTAEAPAARRSPASSGRPEASGVSMAHVP